MPARVPAPEWVPLVNTSLIVISGFFLLLGYYFIKSQRNIVLHRRSMLTACAFAAAFLVVYVTRAAVFETKLFAGEGWVRTVYLTILVVHTIVATLVGPFAIVTLRRALRGDYGKHRQIARLTFPMWLFVVVSGWVVYWMLHMVGDALAI